MSIRSKVILVTCRHIAVADVGNFSIRFNLRSGGSSNRSLDSIKRRYNVDWMFHPRPSIDVAAIIFGIDTNRDDILLIPDNFAEKFNKVDLGDDVFILGYPMGLSAKRNVTPIVRSGIISAKIEGKRYLIDANLFPGNSGGPVFLKPSVIDFQNRTIGTIRPPKFVGIVSKVLNYIEPAIGRQSGRPRIIFEENAALAEILSVDRIFELLKSRRFTRYINGLTRPN